LNRRGQTGHLFKLEGLSGFGWVCRSARPLDRLSIPRSQPHFQFEGEIQ